MSHNDHPVLQRLRTALGDHAVLTAPRDTAGYLSDWTGEFRGDALAVVRPADTAAVAEVVRACAETRVSIVPQGGNTGLAGGAVPATDPRPSVVVSLERLRSIRSVDPIADTLTVEAGVTLRATQEAAATAGRSFPLSLGSEGSCTIGGNIATNAGGTAVLRYGMMRDLVLGLEVVLPDGRVWDGMRPLRKDNSGYDLKQLFIGAEGTLGIVTATVLRMVPPTPRRATALLALPDVAAAVALLPVLRRAAGELLTAWELMNRQSVDLVLRHQPGTRDPFATPAGWYGLVEVAGSTRDVDERLEEALASAVAQGLVADAVVASGPSQRASLWALRDGISEGQKAAGTSVKHDVTLPIAALADFVGDTGPRLQRLLPGLRLVTYGHVGDGNLHYNISAPVDDPDHRLRSRAAEITTAVYDAVAARGGSISAEHGLGVLKRDAAAAYKSSVEVDLMRAVKRAIDPHALMNPGKVVP